jgi:hypothetical protein
MCIIVGGLYYANSTYAQHMTQIYIGLGIAALMIIKPSQKKRNDMSDDFNTTYAKYLKDKQN